MCRWRTLDIYTNIPRYGNTVGSNRRCVKIRKRGVHTGGKNCRRGKIKCSIAGIVGESRREHW
jgi:hypothetical protein